MRQAPSRYRQVLLLLSNALNAHQASTVQPMVLHSQFMIVQQVISAQERSLLILQLDLLLLYNVHKDITAPQVQLILFSANLVLSKILLDRQHAQLVLLVNTRIKVDKHHARSVTLKSQPLGLNWNGIAH